jgi:2-desacetyl-2-hydroxyethyl bacteriochlorophyllide A dehydrogenase
VKVPFIVGPGELQLREVENPVAGPRDVVIDVAMAGVCGSDLGMLAMGGVGGQPTPLGHELSGTVVQAGAEVSSVRIGDRVALNPLFNMIGNGGPEGGFARQLLVRDVAANPGALLAIPDSMTFEQGALVEPIAVAIHAANRLGAKPGDRIALFGAGPIGLATLAVLRHRGIEDIVVFELSPFRRARAEQLGARAVIDPSQKPANEALVELHGQVEGARVAMARTSHYVEATGAPILPEIIANAAPRSTILVVALHKQPEAVAFLHVMAKELTITGTMGYPDEFGEAIAVVDSGVVDFTPLVSHRFDGDEVLEAFATAKQADRSAKVLVNYTK